MTRFLTIGLTVMVLVALMLGSVLWARHLKDSVLGYRSPLVKHPVVGGGVTDPLVRRVVLVIVDGLRYDTSRQMPTLESLRQRGAHAVSLAPFPTVSQPTWTTLVSGAEPEINDAALVNEPYEAMRPITPDNLFAAARRAGLTTALAGNRWWQAMIPADLLDARYFAAETDAVADRRVTEAALRFLKHFRPKLLVVHLTNVDAVAHDHGTVGHEYRQAALHADQLISSIADSMDLEQDVLLVTVDHGHIDQGGHGGLEGEVRATPFVMVGSKVLPGAYGVIHQTDIAPTVATLLGMAVPAWAQGTVLFPALKMEPAQRAERGVYLAKQHVALGEAYLTSIGMGELSEEVWGDARVAYSSLEVKNYESAYNLANFAVQEVEREMRWARWRRIGQERLGRLSLAAVTILVPLVVLWWKRSKEAGLFLLAALLSTFLYHLVFLGQGNAYTVSAVESLPSFLTAGARGGLFAVILGALVVLARLWRVGERSWLRMIISTQAFYLIQCYLLVAQLAFLYFLNGFGLTWYLPNPLLGFLQYLILVQLGATAAFSLPMPLFVALVHGGALTIANRLWLRPQHAPGSE
ncbi:MAG: alkaline phosphatase family protein [Anaerolineae bacterium]